MEPPWSVDPGFFADGFWILGKSDYLKAWREWFFALPDDEKSNYISTNPVTDSAGAAFYDVFGVPLYDPGREAEKFRDSEGFLVPPWLAFPKVPLGSMGWRMGPGEDYWLEFDGWYRALSTGQKLALKAKYPEPSGAEQGFPWTGFYNRKETQ